MFLAHLELWPVALLLLGDIAAGQRRTNQVCILTNGKPGRCVPLNDCPEVAELAKGLVLYQNQLDRIEAVLRGCGSDLSSSDPIVCCASPRLPERKAVVPTTTTTTSTTTAATTTTSTTTTSTTTTTTTTTPATTSRPRTRSTTTTRRPTPSTTLATKPNRNILPERCGEEPPAFNVFFGVEDEANKHVWAVLLEIRKSNNSSTGRCVGTLIHESFVLTAAHCLHPRVEYIRMLFGVNRVSGFVECTIAGECQERLEADFIIHHNYNSHTSANDIALVRMREPVSTGADTGIIPACLPLDHVFDESLIDDPSVISLGWGETHEATTSDSKMLVLLNVMPQDECGNQLRNSNTFNRSMLYSVMCTRGLRKGQDVCQGDSGAPLLQLLEKRFYVVGVVSFGPKCGTSDVASVSLRVSEYTNWILTNMMHAPSGRVVFEN
uniref:CLIP domain-containing serine protease n=1 Tax=Anopheles dirus TaxID=7168 RepID=A0A182NPS3_9DIPT